MAYTAPWRPVSKTRPWPTPSAALTTLHLLGDAHIVSSEYPLAGNQTTYDAIGRDLRDKFVRNVPAAQFQMGDLAAGDSGQSQTTLTASFALFKQWFGDYGLAQPWMVMGNHDVPRSTYTPAQWAAYWGYATPSYAVDLGTVRALVLNPTGPAYPPPAGYESCPHNTAVIPVSASDVAWLDARLSEDTRPTLLLNHAPFTIEPTKIDGGKWYGGTSVATGNSSATALACADLLAVIDSHPHAIAWMHGHSHHVWNVDQDTKPNTGLMSVGSRNIARVDCGAIFSSAAGSSFSEGKPVSFYVSVRDDGKSVEIRWRKHDISAWASPPGMAGVQVLTAT